MMVALGVVVAPSVSASVPAHYPVGHQDSVRATGIAGPSVPTGLHSGSYVNVAGWSFDPDARSTSAIVRSYDGSTLKWRDYTRLYRTDVNRVYGLIGYHGYSTRYPVANGTHRICTYQENIGLGAPDWSNCIYVAVNGSPYGSLDAVAQVDSATARLAGWAADPDDTRQSITVSYRVDGGAAVSVAANLARPDVNSVVKISGNHGYAATVRVSPGTHTVCVYAQNIGPSAPAGNLGCRQLTIAATPTTCTAPSLSAVSLPNLAYVGDHPRLTVSLTCAAASAVQVSLTSTDPVTLAPAIAVPATITIGAGNSSASIDLAPQAYRSGPYTSTVSAQYGGTTLARSMTVDPGLSLFDNSPDSCSPNDVNLNIGFTGTAPTGGTTVQLTSDNPAITVPVTASFQAGALGGGVAGVTVNPVNATTTVTLTATLGTTTMSKSVTLIRSWQSGDKITLTPFPGAGPFYGNAYGYEVLVSLDHPAPVGNFVSFNGSVTTDAPNSIQDLGPNPVSIIPGCDSTQIPFSVPYTTQPVHASITLSMGGSTATTSITIEPSLASITLPATITGGQSATGTLTLAGAPDMPDTVTLQPSWGILTVPNTVTVPAGQTSVTFPISTAPVTTQAQMDVLGMHLVGYGVADSVQSNQMSVTP